MSTTIVHTTDLIHDETESFEHGVALALASRSKLISLHANAPESAKTGAHDACVIVMATRGHDSVRDVIRGSHTDRVLHRTRCPLLAIGV